MDHQEFLEKAKNQGSQYMAANFLRVYKVASGMHHPVTKTLFYSNFKSYEEHIMKIKFHGQCYLTTSPPCTRQTSLSFT